MKISKNLACAIVNADMSGLNNSDIEAIDRFLEKYPHFMVIDWNEGCSDINDICDITRLWDCCVEIEIKDKVSDD